MLRVTMRRGIRIRSYRWGGGGLFKASVQYGRLVLIARLYPEQLTLQSALNDPVRMISIIPVMYSRCIFTLQLQRCTILALYYIIHELTNEHTDMQIYAHCSTYIQKYMQLWSITLVCGRAWRHR